MRVSWAAATAAKIIGDPIRGVVNGQPRSVDAELKGP